MMQRKQVGHTTALPLLLPPPAGRDAVYMQIKKNRLIQFHSCQVHANCVPQQEHATELLHSSFNQEYVYLFISNIKLITLLFEPAAKTRTILGMLAFRRQTLLNFPRARCQPKIKTKNISSTDAFRELREEPGRMHVARTVENLGGCIPRCPGRT